MGAAPTSAAGDAEFDGSALSGGTVVVGAGGTEPRTLNVLTAEGNVAWGGYVMQPVVTSASKYDHRGILIHDLLEGIGKGENPGPTFEEGFAVQAVLDAVERSVETHDWAKPETA